MRERQKKKKGRRKEKDRWEKNKENFYKFGIIRGKRKNL